MDDFKIFIDLMGSLIAKYADKIDIDNLPDVPKYTKPHRIRMDSMTFKEVHFNEKRL